jgi:PHD/YefM family antitoxin component YafN of YafNO toxin-antitoxin module
MLREHEIIDLSEEDWESAHVMSDEDYQLIMQTASELEQRRDQQAANWAWMSMGYED